MKNSMPKMKPNQYLQIGAIALRDGPGSKLHPAIPVYVRAEDCDADALEKLTETIGRVMTAQLRRERSAQPDEEQI